jgi:hypothetical protein
VIVIYYPNSLSPDYLILPVFLGCMALWHSFFNFGTENVILMFKVYYSVVI